MERSDYECKTIDELTNEERLHLWHSLTRDLEFLDLTKTAMVTVTIRVDWDRQDLEHGAWPSDDTLAEHARQMVLNELEGIEYLRHKVERLVVNITTEAKAVRER